MLHHSTLHFASFNHSIHTIQIGSIAPLSKSRMNISNDISFKLLHSLRSCHDGVLVGVSTVDCDRSINITIFLHFVEFQYKINNFIFLISIISILYYTYLVFFPLLQRQSTTKCTNSSTICDNMSATKTYCYGYRSEIS